MKVMKIYLKIIVVLLNFLFLRIMKNYQGSHKNIKQHNCFQYKTMILILIGFLKDHVTLKTGVMTDENVAFSSHFKIYKK